MVRVSQGGDFNFYAHELKEFTLMRDGIPYELAHKMSLEWYGISPYAVYPYAVIVNNPQEFSQAWYDYWEK